jgi:hypothetical protein
MTTMETEAETTAMVAGAMATAAETTAIEAATMATIAMRTTVTNCTVSMEATPVSCLIKVGKWVMFSAQCSPLLYLYIIYVCNCNLPRMGYVFQCN